MCKNSGKTTDHLLLHCAYAHDLWSLVFYLCVAYAHEGSGFAGLLERGYGRHHFADLWGTIPSCAMWTILWERNQTVFGAKIVFITFYV